MNILAKSDRETFELGKKIGKILEKNMVIALEGDLGGGKTTFTKGLAKGMGVKEEVTSPSFSLEKVYRLTSDNRLKTTDKKPKSEVRSLKSNLYHFDFYRIESPKDMMGYELSEALQDPDGIVVVEWAEKIEAELPKEKLVVKFEYVGENERKIKLIPKGERYNKLINN